MTNRAKTNVILLAFIPMVMEFWQLWKGDLRDVNWFIALDYPMNIQWYFRDMGTELTKFLFAVIIFRKARMDSPVRLASTVILVLTGIGVVFFFVNYNRFNHILVYTGASFLTMILAFYKEQIREWRRKVAGKFKRRFDLSKRKIKTVYERRIHRDAVESFSSNENTDATYHHI